MQPVRTPRDAAAIRARASGASAPRGKELDAADNGVDRLRTHRSHAPSRRASALITLDVRGKHAGTQILRRATQKVHFRQRDYERVSAVVVVCFGRSAMIASVVSIIAETEAAFCNATRTTLVGSMTPALMRSS